jgi:hypothetical protein
VSGIAVPAEVIKCRLQLGRNPFLASAGAIKCQTNFRNTFQAARGIFRAEGLVGFFQGYTACLSVDCAQSGFSFLFYELMKKKYGEYKYSQGKERTSNTPETLVLGSVAGGGAALFSNPLDVMCVRLMTQGGNKRYHGFLHCFQETTRHEGVQGLLKGSISRVLATMPYTGICFGVYEGIKRIIFDGELEDFDLEGEIL